MRKARPDSVIASKLTEGQQAEFFATAQKLTVAEAAKLLQREFSVRLDKSNVSRWLQLYQQRNAFELYCGRLGAAGEQARGMLKELDREALGEALYGMAQQAMFQAHFDDASEKTKQSMAYVLSALGKALTDEKKLRQQERALDQENISATERNRIARE
ncbi:MAG: hypothetical protein LBK60_02395, partial [Verrucomicrobiales bacterium]|nr:hypothetical protein [Verrucomicrobiales bacterium]